MLTANLLGQFTLRIDNQPVDLPSRPAQSLLAYLLLNPRGLHRREHLAGQLWPDSLESSARKNLRNAVWQLRKALGEPYLVAEKDAVGLNPSAPIVLDYASLADEGSEANTDKLLRAVAAYRGELLPGFYEDWVQLERERLRGLFERRMQALLDRLQAEARWPELHTWAEHWIAQGEVPEPAFRAMMLAHAAQGDLAGVANDYRRCVQALKEALDVGPSAETQALYERLMRGEKPAGPAAGPAADPRQRYQAEELLATGGQGEVYRGRDTVTGQPVVIKRLLPGPQARNADAAARIVREGQLLAQLAHPNIVRVLAAYEQGGQYSLVMEYLPAGTLRDRLNREGRLPVAQALNIALELADALARAHHLDIIHRDVKPENVLLANDGTPRLTDFGLARLRRDEARLTQAGSLIGSPAYMSPEAVRGLELDARSDVWSFGVMLYEMLAGQPPFEGEQAMALLANILEKPAPDLSAVRPEAPPALAGLLKRMLAKDRDQRLGSMRQAAAELEAIASGRTPASPGTSRTQSENIHGLVRAVTPTRDSKRQQIRFCAAPDGVRLAYATLGQGPLLIKAGNPLTHLEYDLYSPVWRHWWEGLSRHHTLVRYDERGCGLSDWDVTDYSLDAWVGDLEAIANEFGSERFVLLGVSQGASVAIAYAVRHPERVSHLILYGGYARGRFHRGLGQAAVDEAQTLLNLMRIGWGKEVSAFRQVFASLFMPEGGPEHMKWYSELARVTTSPENAATMEAAFYDINVTDLAPQVRVPTLILHARGDAMVPFEEGRVLAAHIPGARLVPLESNNHILLEDEPAWGQFLAEVHGFVQAAEDRDEPAPEAGKVEPETSAGAVPPHTYSREREQQIRFCTAPDGVRIAYATVGEGPPLIKAANWMSHLEYDWISPIWRHWLLGLSAHNTLIRYDERACGLSDWDAADLSFEAWLSDLETVVEASGQERFALLGISQGGSIAVAYAVRHPERVSHLILYGAYARGRKHRNLTPEQRREREVMIDMIHVGWGQENPAFRQVFTSMFIPEGTPEHQRWFNDLQRVSASPENAARITAAFDSIDVRDLAPQVKAPTLVLHATGDERVPFAEGRLLAALIPGARLVPLDSRNHVLLEDEPAWQRFLSEVHPFLRG